MGIIRMKQKGLLNEITLKAILWIAFVIVGLHSYYSISKQ